MASKILSLVLILKILIVAKKDGIIFFEKNKGNLMENNKFYEILKSRKLEIEKVGELNEIIKKISNLSIEHLKFEKGKLIKESFINELREIGECFIFFKDYIERNYNDFKDYLESDSSGNIILEVSGVNFVLKEFEINKHSSQKKHSNKVVLTNIIFNNKEIYIKIGIESIEVYKGDLKLFINLSKESRYYYRIQDLNTVYLFLKFGYYTKFEVNELDRESAINDNLIVHSMPLFYDLFGNVASSIMQFKTKDNMVYNFLNLDRVNKDLISYLVEKITNPLEWSILINYKRKKAVGDLKCLLNGIQRKEKLTSMHNECKCFMEEKNIEIINNNIYVFAYSGKDSEVQDFCTNQFA